MQFWNEKQNCKLTTPLGWVDGQATSDTCEQRTAPFHEPENHFFNAARKNIHSQSLAWLNLPSGHPFGWGCKFAPNHGFTVHSTNGLLVILYISLQGESLCHSDTNLNRLAPRFGTVLLVHVCFQNTEIPYSRCIWVHMEYEKSDHPRLRHCLTHIGTLKLIIFC